MKKLTEKEKQRRSLLGCRIKAARLVAGYPTIHAFTSKCFTSGIDQMLAQWETGRRLPSDEVLEEISKHCNVNYHWLKAGEGDMLEGIEIQPDEAIKQKAIAGFELLARKYAQQKEQGLPLTDVERSLARYGEGRRLTLPEKQGTEGSIDADLLAAIIEEVVRRFEARAMSLDAKQMAKAAAKLCANIAESTEDKELRLKMVKPVVGACEWLF